ncbi:hypothetical protein BKA69DRAFT_1053177 [Paraphysoderma sedebokerense]|nr:hypothetical protein BKA69DRAFT_1053115 [Paraphysoderma sedebokerense]KAI9145109.1 hypothetical protein BKA69DRAFT_1053177 [Paraphysoderma sedebokerense]
MLSIPPYADAKGAAVCASSTKNQDHLLSSSMIPSAGPLTVPLPESTLHNPSVSMVASAFPNIFSSKTTTPINVPIDCPPSIWSVTDQIGEQEFWTTWKQIQPPHCCICLDDTPGTESNRLLVCASPHCDVCVHQECYGEINSAEVWFCQKCLAGDHEAVIQTLYPCKF